MSKPDVKDIKNWSCLYPYEYSDWANESWYCNLDWQEDWIGDDQLRYLGKKHKWVDRSSDTNDQYGEKSLKLDSPGFKNWIDDQLNRAVKAGVGYIEWDNQDNTLERDRSVLMKVFKQSIVAGLKPILKNPTDKEIKEFGGLRDAFGVNSNSESAIAGCVFERGTMSPHEFAASRKDVNPTLQATWVRHGGHNFLYGTEFAQLGKQIHDVPGTSVQWGPKEYNGMQILVSNVQKSS